ncbi:MAG: D-alanyl-D-alanine carboxypeptidase family protein [Proteobacteria bacterium]|nr:D-alanyl-D-alanine carboxypeptidase family protein [Pseudomonadota bacterium]
MDDLEKIHVELGLTSELINLQKLPFIESCPLSDLVVAEIDKEGRPFILHKDAARAWRQMKQAALSSSIELTPQSGFRSLIYQKKLFENKLRQGYSIADVLKVVAAPGFSEHHSGRAIDFTKVSSNGSMTLDELFESTSDYQWLQENAANFGFFLSYPRNNIYGLAFEPWHWCYQGP